MINYLFKNQSITSRLRNVIVVSSLLVCSVASQTTTADLIELSMTGVVNANQSNINGNCGAQGFSACPYFPLQSTATVTIVLDDTTPVDLTFPASNYYANAITSINFVTDLFSSSYDSSSGFGMIQATNNSLRFHLWDSGTHLTRTGSGNPMHLTPIDTSITHPSDDLYGNIEIKTLVIDLAGLNTLFNKNLPIPPLNQSNFDLQGSSWGVNITSLGTNSLTTGWGGSAGGNITNVMLTNRVDTPATETSDVPTPATLWLLGLGLLGLANIPRRRAI